MSLSSKQIRYLWAVGYFKPSAKGKKGFTVAKGKARPKSAEPYTPGQAFGGPVDFGAPKPRKAKVVKKAESTFVTGDALIHARTVISDELTTHLRTVTHDSPRPKGLGELDALIAGHRLQQTTAAHKTELKKLVALRETFGVAYGQAKSEKIVANLRTHPDIKSYLTSEIGQAKSDTQIHKMLAGAHGPHQSVTVNHTSDGGKTKNVNTRSDKATAFLNSVGSEGLGVHTGSIPVNRVLIGGVDDLGDGRPYALPSGIHMFDSNGVALHVHEMGHRLEETHPGIGKLSEDFIASQRASSKPELLSKLTGNPKYGPTEWAYVPGSGSQKLVSPYVLKKYSLATGETRPSTEVFSLGIEHLYYSPSKFLREHPYHFATIIASLHS